MGFGVSSDPAGVFGQATRASLEAFQHRRGLRVDGVCGRQTWTTLVEAGFSLGDRLLYRRSPMMRGDDVADLQQRLCGLGFDAGRVDGIFGDRTASALAEFQRNSGLPSDAIAGPSTFRELLRVQARNYQPELVSGLWDREALRNAPRDLTGRHVAIGESGGLGATASALSRRLSRAGAHISQLNHPDDSVQAQEANRDKVDVYLGLRLDPGRWGCSTAYYAGYHYESIGGSKLATLIQATLPERIGLPDLGCSGMSIPILRETQMTAVVVEIGPASMVVEHSGLLADALSDALSAWTKIDWDGLGENPKVEG
ncbi:MAG: peptidoglycan-binding protein [Actinobacteria bacterium]|nr:peptidoglycan-binding protein [Actinomycetota bacterium]MCL5445782.1 peptidoglycan-binding protein [Actinomycetota bacterium]